jgi:uncharacterized protein YcfJ
MNIRPLAVVGVAAGILTAGPALADPGHGRGPWARVVAVEPIVRHVVVDVPREVCRNDVVYRSARPGRVAASTVAGGVIGGTIGQAIGNNIGDGDSRALLGLVGAAAGSAIAHDRARNRVGERYGEVAVPVERCAVAYDRVTEERVQGYWVTYRYRGRLHRVRTYEHPGRRILIADRGPRGRRYY